MNMNEILSQSVFFGMFLSLACYQIGMLVKKKTKIALVNPLLVAVVIIICILLALDI